MRIENHLYRASVIIFSAMPAIRHPRGLPHPLLVCRLSLALVYVKWSDGLAFLTRKLYLAELVLILSHILLKSQEQTLGVLWSENHTAVDDCLWKTWQYASEVCDEF